jgi:hypothetical protein
MSKKWIRSVSTLVLISFLALLLPKSLWHDCSHSDHLKTEQKDTKPKLSFNQGTEKCMVCDLHIPLLSNPVNSMELAQKPVSLKEKVYFHGSAVFGACYTEPLRGPPAMI